MHAPLKWWDGPGFWKNKIMVSTLVSAVLKVESLKKLNMIILTPLGNILEQKRTTMHN